MVVNVFKKKKFLRNRIFPKKKKRYVVKQVSTAEKYKTKSVQSFP